MTWPGFSGAWQLRPCGLQRPPCPRPAPPRPTVGRGPADLSAAQTTALHPTDALRLQLTCPTPGATWSSPPFSARLTAAPFQDTVPGALWGLPLWQGPDHGDPEAVGALPSAGEGADGAEFE